MTAASSGRQEKTPVLHFSQTTLDTFCGSAGLSVDQPHPANPLLSHKYPEQLPGWDSWGAPLSSPRPFPLEAAIPQCFDSLTYLLMPGGAVPRGDAYLGSYGGGRGRWGRRFLVTALVEAGVELPRGPAHYVN